LKKKDNTPLLLRIIPTVFPWIEKNLPSIANRFFVYIFFTPLRYRATDKEKKAETFAEKFTMDVEGKKIQCYRWGHGDKIVLVVHGWAGRATQFRRLVKPLNQAGYQVVGFDGPAHGQSEGRNTNIWEFRKVIEQLVNQLGKVHALITHSFGGAAALYAVANGVPVNTVINIASPTISDEVINTYLRAIGGSAKTGEAFKKYMLKKTGKPFSELSALESINRVPPDFHLLLVHDEDDKDVSIEHPKELLKRFPRAQLLQTSGLGHTRILKDDNVIAGIVTFLSRHSSNS
jgi:pimeloyl-ACP methyl ester carboxylesterase